MKTLTLSHLGIAIDRPGKTMLALLLSCVMLFSGCWFKAVWLQDALNDLPVLIQMAQAILQIISITKTDGVPNSSDVAAINNIGNVATEGLTAIQDLYKSYTSANSTTTIADIRAAGNALTTNLEALLQAAQIKNPALLARVTSAVNLIVSTVDTIISLLPASASSADMKAAKVRAAASVTVPKPADLRAAWLSQVGFALAQ